MMRQKAKAKSGSGLEDESRMEKSTLDQFLAIFRLDKFLHCCSSVSVIFCFCVLISCVSVMSELRVVICLICIQSVFYTQCDIYFSQSEPQKVGHENLRYLPFQSAFQHDNFSANQNPGNQVTSIICYLIINNLTNNQNINSITKLTIFQRP